MPDPAREEAIPIDLADIDGSDLESDDDTEFEETDDEETDDDDTVEPTNTEEVLPTPAPSVARMNLNTINIRTGGFAWFSA